MKSVTFLFLMVVGIIELWVASAHSRCPEARPQVVYASARTIAMVTPPEAPQERERVEGLPVPIYPGTRVTEAEFEPVPLPHEPAERPTGHRLRRFLAKLPGKRPGEAVAKAPAKAPAKTVTGLISATEERARQAARDRLQQEVTTWLAPDVPAAWKPPAVLVDHLIQRTEISPVEKDYGTLYEATLHLDFSPPRRAEIIAAYHHELVVRRMTLMGGALAAILTGLAALAGYIRADEATKGYYTNWLRVAATAGVGAAGAFIYRLLA